MPEMIHQIHNLENNNEQFWISLKKYYNEFDSYKMVELKNDHNIFVLLMHFLLLFVSFHNKHLN